MLIKPPRIIAHLSRFLALILVLAPLAAPGAGPRTITWQASISGDDAVSTYSLHFTLYYDADGSAPAGWSETHADVAAPNGLVTVQLGSIEPFLADQFTEPLYLGVAINGDPEMLPRTPLTNTPYEIQIADDLYAHLGDAAAHAPRTTSFAALTDQVLVSQLPAEVTLDTELAESAAAKADLDHGHADQAALIQALADAVAALSGRVGTLEAEVVTLQQQVNDAEAGVGTVAALFNVMEIDGTEVRFNGVNVHVTNGSGSADTLNGLGNLIVGYNLADGSEQRGGSHNLVVGDHHQYNSHGGFVAGHENRLFAPYASVLGGELNRVTAAYGTVAGGRLNEAGGDYASVLGGEGNDASGGVSTIAGGSQNSADGVYSSIAGGSGNSAPGTYASVAGGSGNSATGAASTISGGSGATVADPGGESFDASFGGAISRDGDILLVSGVNLQLVNGSGAQTTLNGLGNLLVGYNDANTGNVRGGSHNLVLGSQHSYQSHGGLVTGLNNGLNGPDAAVLGGSGNTASGSRSVAIGGTSNNLIGSEAVVVGGTSNAAVGLQAVVVGGRSNEASGLAALTAGGADNRTFGAYGAGLGGAFNQVFGQWGTVAGGREGNAEANYSTVAGGWLDRATAPYASAFGGYDNSAGANWAVALGGKGNSSASLYGTVAAGVEHVGSSVVFSGVNVQVVNGTADTGQHNGLGNLIIGYNGADEPRARGGSHNLVVGDDHSFGSHAGIVAGRGNSITAPGASVLAGEGNSAAASYSAIVAGYQNQTSGVRAALLGGNQNLASGVNATLGGGALNEAAGDESGVWGGYRNAASGRFSAVGGGTDNDAGQNLSSIPTGRNIHTGGGAQ